MNQQIQGSHALSSGEVPAKRKRGRPRRDSAPAENSTAVPVPDSSKKSKVSGGSGDEANGMVGQVVTGVIDGTFDAGYLLNVKVGDTDTQLRGLVFLPGRFTPITAENDVAPYAKMYSRRAVPFPTLKQQSQPAGSVHPKQSDKQPADPEDQVPKIALAFYSQLANPQSGKSEAPVQQSMAVMLPVADNVPKTDTGLSMSGKVMLPQMEEPKVDEPDKVLQEIEASKLVKGPTSEVETNEDSKTEPESEPIVNTNLGAEASKLMKGPDEVEATEESKAEPESEPAADVFPGIETSTVVKEPTDVEANNGSKEEPAPMPVDISRGIEAVVKEPEIHDQALSSNPRNDLTTYDEVKTLNLELNQAPVASEPAFENSKLVDNSMKKEGNEEGVLAEPQSGNAVEVPNGEGKPANDATDITGAVSLSAMGHNQEAIPSESKLASEGRVPPGLTDMEIRSPSGEIISMECDEKDAILLS